VIPLARPRFGEAEEKAVAEVLRSGWVAQGPTTAAFETEFAAAIGVPCAIATSSCTTGLHLAVVAAGIGPGDEVILPSYTFPATANVVIYAGATPVLVDVERDTLNIDLAAVHSAITPRTRAVIGVHLFGCPCAARELADLCEEKGLTFIEDAACAIGTEVAGRRAGGFGKIACFSLHARKILSTGEGGMLTTSDARLAELLVSLRTHGADRSAEAREAEGAAPSAPHHVRLGFNYRLSDIQAAVGRVQLKHLEEFLTEREEAAGRYDEAFRDLPVLRRPGKPRGGRHSYQSYVVVLERECPVERDVFMAKLAESGVSTRIGTYAVHVEPYFTERFPVSSPLPVSEEAARRSVALPIYNGMTAGDQERVIDSVRRALQS
jgi:dTDP-4-amino-4,6-dideoxygalactose transaminase